MTQNEFSSEIKDYVNNTYDIFREYQDVTWSILSYVNKLFRENNLTYYLAYGTLLGAIRDRGKIPWDYDVDIHVKINDKEKLLDILRTKLSDEFYYMYTDKMDNYPAECLRICKKGYTYMAFHVDVFFLIGSPASKEKRKSFLKEIKRWTNFRLLKYAHLHDGEYPQVGKFQKILLKIYSLKYKFISESYLKKKENSLLNAYNINNSSYCISYLVTVNWGDYEFEVYPNNIFESSIDIEIEGELYPIPSGFKDYLSLLYKNYQEYLPIESRFDEFYTQFKRIERRQEFYIKNILKLKS